jgi:hypothetical protein
VNAYKIQLAQRYSVNQDFHWQSYRLWSAIFSVGLIPNYRNNLEEVVGTPYAEQVFRLTA